MSNGTASHWDVEGSLTQQPAKEMSSAAVDTNTEEIQLNHSKKEGSHASAFSDKTLTRRFLRNVYLILLALLLINIGAICFFLYCRPVKRFVQKNLWFYLVSYGLYVVFHVVLMCRKDLKRRHPANAICLCIGTFIVSYVLGAASSFHKIDMILIGAALSAALVLSAVIFTLQSKIEFTMLSGMLFVIGLAILFSGVNMVALYYTLGTMALLSGVFGGIFALMFGAYLVFETQRVVSGRTPVHHPEEILTGALQLYSDVTGFPFSLLRNMILPIWCDEV